MDAERQEDEVRDATEQMARGEDEMEHRLEELEEDITETKKVAARRQDAPEQTGVDEVAGEWGGESSGAQQGEDAEDTARAPHAGADESGDAERADRDED